MNKMVISLKFIMKWILIRFRYTFLLLHVKEFLSISVFRLVASLVADFFSEFLSSNLF